jgi:hypothetical protein
MTRRGLKTNKTGRSESGEKFARLFLATMKSPAWLVLSPYAQRLYPWLLLEFHGPKRNNNGRIALSVKQAAELLSCNSETARKAFRDLQSKGFITVTRRAALGIEGEARGHLYELTELGTPRNPVPRKLFRDWKPGTDFPVVTANVNNPRGVGGVQNLKSQLTAQVETAGPVLTRPEGPNLRRKSKTAKITKNRTYGTSSPYLPEGTGPRHVSQPIDPAAEFIGEPKRFAVVLPSGAVRRVGVRAMRTGGAA